MPSVLQIIGPRIQSISNERLYEPITFTARKLPVLNRINPPSATTGIDLLRKIKKRRTMRDSKMMLEAELDRPHLPVFDAPALAPDIHELARGCARNSRARRSLRYTCRGVVASCGQRDRAERLLSARLGPRGVCACARTHRRESAPRLGQCGAEKPDRRAAGRLGLARAEAADPGLGRLAGLRAALDPAARPRRGRTAPPAA